MAEVVDASAEAGSSSEGSALTIYATDTPFSKKARMVKRLTWMRNNLIIQGLIKIKEWLAELYF